MKISRSDPKNPLESPLAATVNGNGARRETQWSAGSGIPTDQAQLSKLSSYLASAISGSPAHVAKLAELNTALSNGQYNVDAYAVSASIIQHSVEFGGSSYHGLST